MDLPLLSALFLLFALTMYVMLDGFDLGVGALLLAQRDERVRNRMVDAIAPTWDGNETWLIMAGVTLLAGFPLAYGILLPAFVHPGHRHAALARAQGRVVRVSSQQRDVAPAVGRRVRRRLARRRRWRRASSSAG